MKKLITFLLILPFIVVAVKVNAQPVCEPDTSINAPGIHPSVLPLAVEGKPYTVCATIVVPPDTMIPGIPLPADINFFRLDSAAGLPPWLSFACNPDSCVFTPGHSCVKITGNPPVGSAGKYEFEFHITLNVTIPNFGTLEFPDTVKGFYIHVVEMCMPDTTQTQTGIYPDSFPPLCENMMYVQCATVNIPPDTMIPGIPLPATINYFRLDSAVGLPPWLQYVCSTDSCKFEPGQSCIKVAGCPPCGSAGRYDVLFFITLNVTIPGFGTLEFPDTVHGYFFDVEEQTWVTNRRTTRATLNWKPTTGATGYEIQGGEIGLSPIMLNTGSATSLVATSLVEGKCYYWRVRPTAGAIKGEWSCWDTFCTCAPPVDLHVTNLTNSSAKLNWSPGPANISFTVAGRPNPGGPGSIVTLNTGTNTMLNATGLAACQEYVWTVYAACEGGSSTDIADPNYFTTLGCPAKGELSTLDVLPASLNVEIVPNPAEDYAKILVAGVNNEENLRVEIYDMTGKLISGYDLNAAPYMSELQINISEMSEGIYQVITRTATNMNVQKLVIGK